MEISTNKKKVQFEGKRAIFWPPSQQMASKSPKINIVCLLDTNSFFQFLPAGKVSRFQLVGRPQFSSILLGKVCRFLVHQSGKLDPIFSPQLLPLDVHALQALFYLHQLPVNSILHCKKLMTSQMVQTACIIPLTVIEFAAWQLYKRQIARLIVFFKQKHVYCNCNHNRYNKLDAASSRTPFRYKYYQCLQTNMFEHIPGQIKIK